MSYPDAAYVQAKRDVMHLEVSKSGALLEPIFLYYRHFSVETRSEGKLCRERIRKTARLFTRLEPNAVERGSRGKESRSPHLP